MEADTIAVRMLGGFALEARGQVLAPLPPQATSLLGFLLYHRSRPQTRDLLAGRFWSDLPEDRARKRLSHVLWQIKSALSELGFDDLVIANSSTVEIGVGARIEIDSESFEDQLTDFERELRGKQVRSVLTERLSELVAGFPGDFLAGYYDDWIEPERSRIRERYHGALEQLIDLHKSRSQYDAALRFARMLVGQEPLREDLHRETMRLHALLGQTLAAERQFEACRRVLAAELGVEPSAETVALLERIRNDAPAPAASLTELPDAANLVGRGRELAVLRGRVDELLRGSGGVVMIEGEPGIGKSRLIQELIEVAEWRGARVLAAEHTERSRRRPYEGLQQALAPVVTGLRAEHLAQVVEPVWLAIASGVLPGIRRLVGTDSSNQPLRADEESTRISEAIARVVLAQGGLGPTLLILEDVHWCDDDTMQILVRLGPRLARSGVLLCLSYRRFEAERASSIWAGIGELEALSATSRLVLPRLGTNEVRELIESRIGPGGLPVSVVGQLVDVAAGNPLYALEAVRHPAALLAGPMADENEAISIDLPAPVARAIETRLDALDPEARGVLDVLAALGEPSSASVVAAATGMDKLATLETLTRTTDLGFVVDDDEGRCRFSHDQTRRHVYRLLPADGLTEVHDRIYRALEWLGVGTADQMAHHARLAGRMGVTLRWHREAADQALAINGYRTAANHFEQVDHAADELRIPLVDRVGDLLAYEETLDVLGRRSEQIVLLKRLSGLDLRLDQALELTEREVWLLINTDEPLKAAELALETAEQAAARGQATVGLLTGAAMGRYRAGEFHAARSIAERAMEAAIETPDRVMAQTILGKALVDLLRYDEGLVQLGEAAEEARRVGDDRARIEALGYVAVAEFGLRRYDPALKTLATTLDLSRSIGYRLGEGAALMNLAAIHTALGHGGQALGLFTEASEVMGSLGSGRGEALIKFNLAGLQHYLLGDDKRAAELARSAAVFFRSTGDASVERLAMAVSARVDARAGRRQMARRRLVRLLSESIDGDDAMAEIMVRRALADLEMGLGQYRNAVEHLSRVVELGQEYPLDNLAPNVLASRAWSRLQLDGGPGTEQLVAADLGRALDLNMAGSEQAHVTSWLCANVLQALGQDQAAAEQYRMAYGLLAESLEGLPVDVVERSWRAVPVHVRILEDYERHFARTTPVQLPHRSAPLGRPLRPEELVELIWTVSHPDDWELPTAAERRRHRLVRMVSTAEEAEASARVSDLAEALGVSDRTVKRDLSVLRREGMELRTRRAF